MNNIEYLKDYNENRIKQIVKSYVLDKIDIDIIDIQIYGNRTKEAAREDDLFNILNDDPLYIDDIKVDINPITGRTIKEYMKNLF